ncbi:MULTISPECIES: hypothetical protein [unclassified Butyricicoccus]|jgi:hypothetical protein|nr:MULTISPECIES: hypothetical protein [unclassified Butyricicoccus]
MKKINENPAFSAGLAILAKLPQEFDEKMTGFFGYGLDFSMLN